MTFLDFRIWSGVKEEVWEDMCDSIIAPPATAMRRIAEYPQGDRLDPRVRTSTRGGVRRGLRISPLWLGAGGAPGAQPRFFFMMPGPRYFPA